MTIAELMKDEDAGALRLSDGRSWLVYDIDTQLGSWAIYTTEKGRVREVARYAEADESTAAEHFLRIVRRDD